MFHKLQYTDGKWSEWRNSRWRSKLEVYYWPIIVWPRLSCCLWFIKYRSKAPNWPAADLKFAIQKMPQLILNCFIVRPKISAIMVEVPRKCKWHDGRRRAAPHGHLGNYDAERRATKQNIMVPVIICSPTVVPTVVISLPAQPPRSITLPTAGFDNLSGISG